MKTMRVELTTIAPMLGTTPSDKQIHETYVAGKAPDAATMEEEIAAHGIEEVAEKTMTVFPRNAEGKPFIWNYQIRGFFKSACSAMSKVDKSYSSKLKAYKKQIDLRIMVYPDAKNPSNRQIPIIFDGEITDLQRPLRASTPQGERVALAHSECIPENAKMTFDIVMLIDSDEDMVREWLDYGQFNGLLQWRNAGYGAFTWKEVA